MCELSPVSFHGDTIFCVEFEGQPFAPMKPIVENMGLAWQTQSRKLSESKERWGIIMMMIPSEGGEQETTCLPVRKLPAWLASINPKKVAPELREKIEIYQNECDDALWDYWIKGRAERQSTSLSPSDQNIIQTLVKVIADRYPPEEQKRVFMQVWMRFRNHFRLGSYKDLPQSKMAEAVTYLANLKVNEKGSQKQLPPAYTPLAEAGKDAMAHIMDLRRDLTTTSIELMEIMQRATHHGRYISLNERQKALGSELGQSVGAFFMCINHNMIAVEHMFRAFCEAEKMIFE